MTHSADPAHPHVVVAPPDLSIHGEGDGPTPHVWTFDGPQPGPHAAVVACVHGNETCGAHALDALLRARARPRRGRLSLVLANVEAFQAFDPSRPYATRFLDEDMNRVWTRARLEGPGDSRELRRARALRPLFDEVDTLLDLHSMHTFAPPLAMAGRRPRGVALARGIGWPATVVMDEGHVDGVRLRDYAHFDAPDTTGAAVLVECGQHWEAGSDRRAVEVAWRFLRAAGSIDLTDLPDASDLPGLATDSASTRVVQVVDRIDLHTDDYHFVRPFQGGEVLAEGAPILRQGDTLHAAPFDGCELVMPTTGLRAGQTAVRLARQVATS